tara:strand:- start:1320 stop:2666 length:1347 start_codon:yes stop_codon:yes gene_type:complete
MSGLPANWLKVKLEGLAEDISYGYTAPSSKEQVGPHLLRITDIQENNVSWSTVPYCEIDSKQAQKYLLKENDLLFARTGATVGKSFLIKGEIPEAVYASYLIRVRCLQPEATSYLAHYFQSQDYWRQITEFSAGIGQPNVNGSKLKDLDIPLPPAAEQIRIVAKLDELLIQVDTLKARIDGIPALLKRFRQSVLAAAVTGRLTEEWRGGVGLKAATNDLGSFVSIDIGHAFKSKDFVDQGIPLLRGQNIEPGSLRWTETKCFPEVSLSCFRHLFLEAGDIVLAMDRPIISSGLKVARARPSDLPCVLVQRVARFTNFDGLLPDYLYLLLQDISFKNYIQPNQTGSDIPHISGRQILGYPVQIPTIKEQTEIVRRVEQLFAFADQLEARVKSAQKRIDRLTQSILAKAFRGELVPQDPNDEPASVLLERIKAQRATSGAAKKTRSKPYA